MTRQLKNEINTALVEFTPDGSNTAHTAWVFPPEFLGFQGHFPGNPVCPGVCVMLAQLEAAARITGTELELLEIENTKFTWPIFPGRRVEGVVKATPAGEGVWRVQADLKRGERRIAKLLLLARESKKRNTP